MIVYLATYPRCGNSLLQQILATGFGILPSAITNNEAQPLSAPDWDIQPADDDSRRATYRRDGRRYPFVMPGPADYLTPSRRRQLARDPDLFVFKTHGLPFRTRIEGERFIHQARHPGAALWSYFCLEAARARSKSSLPRVTLERMIAGQTPFGDWTQYHRRWAEALTGDDLVLSYEQTATDLAGAVGFIGEFLGLEPNGRLPTLEDYRSRHPAAPIRGSSDGYERFYTAGQLQELWARHGQLASEMGYAAPDIGLACSSEQIALLADQLWRPRA